MPDRKSLDFDGRMLPTSGPTLHVADFGGEGPLTLLVHGLGGSHLNWMRVGAPLARSGRVVAVDLPGFGRTPRGRSSRFDALLEAVEAAMDALSPREPVLLVGNSMGGALGLAEAARRPSRVRGLVLACPALPSLRLDEIDPTFALGLALSMAPFGVGARLLGGRMRRMGAAAAVDEMMRRSVVRPEGIPPEVTEAHVELARWRFKQSWLGAAFADATSSLLPALSPGGPVDRALDGLSVPARLVHGKHDRLVPVGAAKRAAARTTRLELVVLEHVGHVPQLEDPDRFVELTTGADPARAPRG